MTEPQTNKPTRRSSLKRRVQYDFVPTQVMFAVRLIPLHLNLRSVPKPRTLRYAFVTRLSISSFPVTL